MKFTYIIFVGLVSIVSLADPITYWIDGSCFHPRFNGAFEKALEDAFTTARHIESALNNPSPYVMELFEIMFRVPMSNTAAFTRVLYIFDNIARNMAQTQNQLTSDIRIYCDDDEFGVGKRWIITPNDPDDPIYAKNDQLPRRAPPGAGDDTPLQQWQDESNWIRMSRDSTGCKDSGTSGETQFRTFEAETTPKGINPDRVAMTICDTQLLNNDLHPENGGGIATNFAYLSRDLTPDHDPFENGVMYSQWVLSQTILHEMTHIKKPYFATDDVSYDWKEIVTLTPEQAIRNAESYTMFAFLVRCIKYKYRLRSGGSDEAARLQTLQVGLLEYDQNL